MKIKSFMLSKYILEHGKRHQIQSNFQQLEGKKKTKHHQGEIEYIYLRQLIKQIMYSSIQYEN